MAQTTERGGGNDKLKLADEAKAIAAMRAVSDEFEMALDANGFGIFNIIVMIVAFPVACAVLFATSVASFASLQMRCDLNLTLEELGLLNSITYFGMIFGGPLWGILSDTIGRRPVLIICHLLDAIFNNCVAFCPTVFPMFVFKFLSGVCISGGYITYMTYLSETQPKKFRTIMIFIVGVMLTVATVMLPLIALALLTNFWTISFGNGFQYNTWRLYTSVCTVPSLIVMVAFILLPESPKFDQVVGKSERTIKTFKFIHRLNHCKKDKADYKPPHLTVLKKERKTLRGVCQHIRLIFDKQNIKNVIFIFLIEFCVLMCQNTIRLWEPQLIVSTLGAAGYKKLSMCDASTVHIRKIKECDEATKVFDASVFYTSIGLKVLSVLGFIAAILGMKCVSPKDILIISLILSVAFACYMFGVYGAYNCLILFGFYLSMEHVASIAIINTCVSVFPTTIRTATLSFIVVIGRIGSALGNLLFPQLILLGCWSIFVWILACSLGIIWHYSTLITFAISMQIFTGAVSLVCSFFLPDPEKAKFV